MAIAFLKEFAKEHLPSGFWSVLKHLRRRAAMARFQRREVTHKYWRWLLRLSIEDPTSAGWYDRDWPESTEFRLLAANKLRPGARVFDFGAHQGLVALMLAAAVGPDGLVVAVEADPFNIAVAERNRKLNGAKNLVVVNAAVGASSGEVLFDTLEAHVSLDTASANTRFVPAITIDELTARFGVPDLVYMDIEGSEGRALKGAPQTLASQADWYVEVHDPIDLERFGSSSRELLKSFPTSAYQLQTSPMYDQEFAPFDADTDDVPNQRFFLFAKRKGNGGY